jgi:putative tricarboxylic transport membrane protein
MIDFDAVSGGLTLLGSSGEAWLYVIPGLLLGLIAGAIPGLSVVVALALVLPLLQYMGFLPGVIFLTSIFTGGGFGCAIPAILINVPGSSTAVGTTFDGYPMTRNGEASRALGIALSSSVVGTLISYILLFFFIQTMAVMVLKLGPSEMFLIALWGLSLIAILSGKNIMKGLLVGVIGVLLGTVGMNAMGTMRGTMGSMHLLAGISTVPAMMALFATPEMLVLAGRRRKKTAAAEQPIGLGAIVRGMAEPFKYPVILVRGALIGAVIGAVPGVGASIANLISYAETRRRAGSPDSFGKGDPRGVIASESANSSSEGGGMATLLTLGIPGGAATAILLAAFSIHNITGGPRFVSDNMDIVYALVFSNIAQAFALLIVGLLVIRVASLIVLVKIRFVVPSVFALTVIGSFAYSGNMSGPVTMLVFVPLAWALRRYGYPVPAAVVGLLLGGMVEGQLVRTMQISGGEISYFTDRPITAILLLGLILSFAGAPLKRQIEKRFRRNRSKSATGGCSNIIHDEHKES